MNQPCYGCTERHMGCHTTCDTYCEWKAEHESKRDIMIKKKSEEKQWVEYQFAIHKRLQRSGKKK